MRSRAPVQTGDYLTRFRGSPLQLARVVSRALRRRTQRPTLFTLRVRPAQQPESFRGGLRGSRRK